MNNLRVVVVGATGNIGSALLRRLSRDERIGSLVGVARRPPGGTPPRTLWAAADITSDRDLAGLFAGADAVVHLVCLFQPSHRPRITWRTNCLGSQRVFDAVARARVPVLLHASSVAAYSPAPQDRRVDETWPTHAWPTAAYCREKAYTERLLDGFESRHPGIRVVRLRPAVVVGAETAAQQRRLFGGPFFPNVRPRLIPDVPGLRFQTVHPDDVADACHAALMNPGARGAYNVAAEPVVNPALLAEVTGGRVLRLPYRPVRAATDAAWRLHLVPTSPYMLDAVLTFPLMDTGRARRELDWRPRYSARDAVAAFLTGLTGEGGADTPPLRRRLAGGGRLREAATGTGERE